MSSDTDVFTPTGNNGLKSDDKVECGMDLAESLATACADGDQVDDDQSAIPKKLKKKKHKQKDVSSHNEEVARKQRHDTSSKDKEVGLCVAKKRKRIEEDDGELRDGTSQPVTKKHKKKHKHKAEQLLSAEA